MGWSFRGGFGVVARLIARSMWDRGVKKFSRKNPHLVWLPGVVEDVYNDVVRDHPKLDNQAKMGVIINAVMDRGDVGPQYQAAVLLLARLVVTRSG